MFSATQPIATAGLAWLFFRGGLVKLNCSELLVLSAVLLYSLYAIYLDRWCAAFTPISIMFRTFLAAVVILTLVTLATGGVPFKSFDLEVTQSLVYMAQVLTAVATTMWNTAIRTVGSNKSPTFINLMPVLGGLASVLFFEEPIGRHHRLGTVLTWVGLTFVLKGGQ